MGEIVALGMTKRIQPKGEIVALGMTTFFTIIFDHGATVQVIFLNNILLFVKANEKSPYQKAFFAPMMSTVRPGSTENRRTSS